MLIPAAEFGSKYKSKRECYNFLAVDCDVYLPAYGKSTRSVLLDQTLIQFLPDLFLLYEECVTIYFLKDLATGKKKRVYGKEVRHIAIP